ncbi:MAG TPA: class II fumarate hydratase [Acidobacteria bacterium]|nr:class II fumarate hydratase [Acidobacteriota bacterium]
MNERVEKDTMGEVAVPADALWGAQTARASANFPISGQRLGREMIRALALIKAAAAEVNRELGRLEPKLAEAIVEAAEEVADGRHDRHFPVDIFQTGSGTSSHMNANEVIANRAIELLGGKIGSKDPVHPNDHVNLGQSSNDVFPSALHIAAVTSAEDDLLPALEKLHEQLEARSRDFDSIVKIGRTHLQDATPIRLGQEFSGYAAQIDRGRAHLRKALDALRELPLGGTAVGTGLNTHPEFGRRMAERLCRLTGKHFVEAENHFEAQGARDGAVRCSGALKALAVSVSKIANDIRWLASGPRFGLGELEIPAVQPGSSIMPGKVNPVIAEALIQVCAQVIGNDAAITLAGLQGHFELNAMQPLMARNLLEQIRLLARATRLFAERVVAGLKARRAAIEARLGESLALATALVPEIGYERAAAIARRAADEERSVEDVALEEGVLPAERLRDILDPRRQTGERSDQ